MSHAPPARTPLYPAHLKLKARMVDFHGWEMPIQYAGIVEEHGHVRTKAGLFDLSHMGRVRVKGPQRKAFLQRILTIDVGKVKPGRCKYTFLLTEKGTVIDDLILYTGEPDDLLVVNASNREKDLAWMKTHAGAGVEIVDETAAVALLAVQGPQSLDVVRTVLGVDPGGLKYYTWGPFGDYMLSRTGYTGEDGFEIFLPAERAVEIWDRFIAAGVPPVGLGARDTLRTEAGMPLYGNDIDDASTPLDAGLDFAVDLGKSPPFVGQEALRAGGPPSTRLAGLRLESRRIPRPGFEVYVDGRKAGVVTSGTWSPTLEASIAMARLPAGLSLGAEAEIDIRGKREKARVVPLPFYRRQKP